MLKLTLICMYLLDLLPPPPQVGDAHPTGVTEVWANSGGLPQGRPQSHDRDHQTGQSRLPNWSIKSTKLVSPDYQTGQSRAQNGSRLDSEERISISCRESWSYMVYLCTVCCLVMLLWSAVRLHEQNEMHN